MTRDEFAQSIKTKYPAYASLDNNTLVDKMLAKYPQYQSQITEQPSISTSPSIPPISRPPTLADAFQKSLATPYGNAVKDAYSNIAGVMSAPAQGMNMAGEALAAPAQLAQGLAQGNPQIPTILKDTQAQTDAMAQGGKDFIEHPLDTMASHPVSTALAAGGLLESGADAIAGLKNSGLIDKIANVFREGPSDEEIASHVNDVQDMVKGAKAKFGGLLNAAKEKFADLPTTVEDKTKSFQRYGNQYNLDTTKPLELPENLKKPAPEMEEDTLGATKKDVTSGPDMPKDLKKTMPFKIGDVDKPVDLNTDISRFKQNLDYIDPKDRIKAASYYQSKINEQVDWTKPGNDLEGLLKQQYKALQGVIESNSPELAEAKGQMKDAYNAVGKLDQKLSEPGAAQAYLKRIFSNPTGKNLDELNRLRQVEKITGASTVDDLFKLFKDKASMFTEEEWNHPLKNFLKKGLPQSPKLLKGLLGNASSPAARGYALSDLNNNQAELQSLRDRLLNNEAQ